MALAFGVLTEIGIIAQLSAAAFESAMPGWTVGQFAVVQHLIRRGDGKTPLDLARIFQQPKTTMTHTLQMLERRGLIETRPNPADGRSKLVHLRPEGRAWHAQALPRVAASQADLHTRLTPGTLEALLPHLAHLRAVMDALRD
jgi:DNA-binding MarR family transcriptional regulator